MTDIRLIVGLGNPGREYERTRHNAGFWWVDAIAARKKATWKKESKFAGHMTIVEEDVFVGPRVVFTDDPHPMGCPRYKECLGGVTVRALARIGANCTLLPGVVVGRDSLVGAGSVVTRHVPDDMVVAGNPARLIKAVAELTCTAGFYERPYEWAPYVKGEAAKGTS